MRLLALEVPDTQNDQGSEGTISVGFFFHVWKSYDAIAPYCHFVTLHDRIILPS